MKRKLYNDVTKKYIIFFIILVICILAIVLFFKNDKTNINKENNNENINSLTSYCTEYSDKLIISSLENSEEKINAMGDGNTVYNVSTNISKSVDYNGVLENDGLYNIDINGTLFVIYKNKLYYTEGSKVSFCTTKNVNHINKVSCDYSNFNDSIINTFSSFNKNISFNYIGVFSNSGSGQPEMFAITSDGKVLLITYSPSSNQTSCGIIYDNNNYPIDKIYSLNFYDGINYVLSLKNGTLITRFVDRENPIITEK